MTLDELSDEIKRNDSIKKTSVFFDYIKKLEDWSSFTAISTTPTLNSATVELAKVDNLFKFRCKDLISTPQEPVNYQRSGYGFTAQFVLKRKSESFVIPFGSSKMTMSLDDSEYFIKGEIRNLHSEGLKTRYLYQVAILQAKFHPTQRLSAFITSAGIKIDNYLRYVGLIRSMFYDIFDFEIDNKTYIAIESRMVFNNEKFLEIVSAVRYSIAFVTGTLYQGETYYFASKDADFSLIEEFGYESNNKRTIKSYSTIVPDELIKGISMQKKYGDTKLPMIVFNEIVEKSISQPELLRCIRLISEAGDLPLELKTSIYSVAIETMRNIVQRKPTKNSTPFKDAKIAKNFILAVKEILDEIPLDSFNSKEAVVKKVENINQVGNTESYIEAFKALGISLTTDDIEALKMRNQFLHGRIPFDFDYESAESELNFVSDKLFQLVSYLILKYCGFHGIVLSQANLRLLMNKEKPKGDKDILRII